MTSPAIKKAVSQGLRLAVPETDLTVSEWAEKYRFVPAERVANPALAGRWRNDRTPYLVEIMDAVTSPGINEIVFVKSAQVGGTEFINNVIGYYTHIDPATILYVCETEPKARAWSVECFAPMIRDTPVLASIFGVAKSRDSTNQIESKSFPGGHFALAWATSPSTLSSRPVRVLLRDETDAHESTKEGDPLELSEARTKTAGDQRKVIDVSTPRNASAEDNLSTIERRFENSTREKFFVPCPHCDEYQVLQWANVRWDEAPEFAYYACDASGCVIENDDKEYMLERGEWRSTNSDYSGNRRGFWINEIYSPFTTWGQMACAFLEAKRNPDPEQLKAFTNTRLAESWKVLDEKIDYADLHFIKEDYDAEVPDGVLLLTAAVDVQGNRLECEVLGWGMDRETWSIDYKVFPGDPSEPAVWEELRDYLVREFEGRETSFKVKAVCIDSGGHHAQEVYRFCRANAGRRFWAVKGLSTPGNPIAPKKPSVVGKEKYRLWGIGTEAAKDIIFAQLKKQIKGEGDEEHLDIAGGGPGFCHFPSDRDPDYFKQLCAEKKITKMVRGRTVHYWAKVSENARNEALDLRVYNLAAFHILNPDMKSYRSAVRRRREENKPETEESIDHRKNNPPEETNLERKPAPRTQRAKGFVSGGRGKGFVGNY
ncbi:MAG TPA: phage terminase large subunit family protein [Pyrinomonadaceae bacterium]|jgi:phage terminase large subunit GpA-like protein